MNKNKEIVAGRQCFPYTHIKTQNPLYSHLEKNPVAFFCSEYGIEEKLPTYAGGLGILAGDFILEANETGLPLVAVGILYKEGFPVFRPGKSSKENTPDPQEAGFSILKNSEGRRIIVDIEVDNDLIYAQVWVRTYGSAHLFLLDTSIEKNKEEYRAISHYLYSTDFRTKLLQDFVLGVGGVKLLRCLDINPEIYHLNEGHAAFVILALAVEYMHDNPDVTSIKEAMDAVRHNIVGTKHTILAGAGLTFDRDTFAGIVGTYLKRHKANFDDFFDYGADIEDPDLFSTTKLLIKGSVRTNAVSLLHATFEKRNHPNSKLLAITNGVNIKRWRSVRWGEEGTDNFMDNDLWKIHEQNRADLIDFVKRKTETQLDAQALTITWARRFASYKRPELLFTDIERLSSILNSKEFPVQVIVAGLAHEADDTGKKLIEHIQKISKDPRIAGKVAYIPDYNMEVAKMLITGSDLWLSTPERGKEACGTSSMKAGLNGILQFSTSDGWMEEVDWSDKGWTLPNSNTAESLYQTLEDNIIPEFYDRENQDAPEKWVQKMRLTISLVEKYYSSKRMLEDYIRIMYFPEKS